MLIRRAVLDRIAAGEIDTLFRRQKRPTVKQGGTLRTSIGVLDIVEVRPIRIDDITEADARRAGFDAADDVRTELTRRDDGADYRIRVVLAGVDPRLELRERDELTDAEVDELTRRLDAFDARSGRGAWTRTVLGLIADHPHVRAPDLAERIGWDTAPFKANVRKLKELGLTISHSPGYELSPRGRAYVAATAPRDDR